MGHRAAAWRMGQAGILYPLLARVTMVCSLFIGAIATAPLGKGAGPAGAGGGSRGRREYTLVMTREGNPGGGPRGARGALEDIVAVRGVGGVDMALPGVPGARRAGGT